MARSIPLTIILVLTLVACSDDADDSPPGGDTIVADTLAEDASADSSIPDDTIPLEVDAGALDTLPEATSDTKGDTTPADATGDVPAEVTVVSVPYDPPCENIDDAYCVLPWPSNRYLTPDDTTVTGFRLTYDSAALPPSATGSIVDTTPYERFDGFSTGSHPMVLLTPVPDLTDAPVEGQIDRSLDLDSPTLIVDLDTMTLVPHWVELDARAEDPEETILYLRPAHTLSHDTEYAVVLKGFHDADGTPLEPAAAFAAFRDGLPIDVDDLDARRPAFEALFDSLEELGIPRGDLLLAWTFHTSSFESTHDTMLAMRTKALELIGDEGIGCTVTAVDEEFQGILSSRVTGTFTVPSFMTEPQYPAKLSVDDAGDPQLVEMVEVGFTALVPHSLADVPKAGPLLQWGHGLFGSAETDTGVPAVMGLAETSEMIIVATDWAGMSSKDLPFLAEALTDVSKFYMLGDMVRQGMINQITLMRSFLGVCSDLPELNPNGTPLIDTSERYFAGGSQGSILGTTYLTLSPDIDRAALIVGGANLGFMIERSIHYNTFELFLEPSYPKRIDRAILMGFSQHVWEMGETSNWIAYTQEGIDGIGPKDYLYLVTKNDAQVPNQASDIAALTAGLPVLDSSVYVPWGLETISAPFTGSAFVSVDWGDSPLPGGNVAPQSDDGGHYNAAFTPVAFEMIEHYLFTGELIDTCDGYCDVTPTDP